MDAGKYREALILQCWDEIGKSGTLFLDLKGNCMWPIVRNGDRVTILKVPYQSLEFADVAVFQTTPETFHANALFRRLKRAEQKNAPRNFVGKIARVERSGKIHDLDLRPRFTRILQALLSPANPYGLGIFQTLLRKLRESRK